MQESIQVTLERVSPQARAEFQKMVELYWHELMPHAKGIQDENQRTVYFSERFTWEVGDRLPFWAIYEGRKVGFISLAMSSENKVATVEDFYVALAERRKGYGSAIVRALWAYLDARGTELVELNVRRDNPNALSFWEAQGFRIASYRLRQYRDPKTGTSFIGALSSDFTTDAEDVGER